jgi:hypothetical protein
MDWLKNGHNDADKDRAYFTLFQQAAAAMDGGGAKEQG